MYGYGDIKSYCRNLSKPTFWGGEVEMMVITKMLQVPIFVYQPAAELRRGVRTHALQTCAMLCRHLGARRMHFALT